MHVAISPVSKTMAFHRSWICDIPVDTVTVDQLITAMIQWSRPGSVPRYVCYVNAHVHNLARRSRELRDILCSSALCYPDGAGVVWAARLGGAQIARRITAADFLPRIVQELHLRQRRVFLLGGKPGVAQETANALAVRVPGFEPVGIEHGYFSTVNVDRVLNQIHTAQPDLLIVGMGTPQQERFVAQYLPPLRVPLTWSVGALFDYEAGEERRCPAWMGNRGLEWLFRLAMNPRGMASRYLLGNPKFVAAILRDKLFRNDVQSQLP